MSVNPLRGIPTVHELLENPRLKRVLERIHPGAVLSTVRAVLDEVTGEVQAAAAERTWPSVAELAERIARRVMAGDSPGLGPVINATGQVFHPELGSPPWADRALEALVAAGQDYTTAESRAEVDANPAVRLLVELTGAEAALVVNSAAGATLLALCALAGEEVVVGRAHMIRRGPDYSLPDLGCPELARAVGTLHEVGATNQVTLDDYARAIGEWTGAVLVVDTGGATRGAITPALTELVKLAHEKNLPLVHDLGPGSLVDLGPLGMPEVPVVGKSVAAGADLVVFGHPWLGTPPCGILVGRREWIDRIAAHPMVGPLRSTPGVGAALAASLELLRSEEPARHAIPALQLVTASSENLAGRAKRLAPQMAASGALAAAEPIETTAAWGGTLFAESRLPTWCIELRPSQASTRELIDALRRARPAVVPRTESDRVLLDLRSVLPRQDMSLVEAVLSLDNRATDGSV